MFIRLSNVLTDESLLESSAWMNGAVASGPISADIEICSDQQSVKEICVDLLRFYFDLKDSLAQTILRNLASHIRADFEIICSLTPLEDGEFAIKVVFPKVFNRQVINDLSLSIKDVRESIYYIELCIRERLTPLRSAVIDAMEKSQSWWLFDVLRIIDHNVELTS